MSVLLNNILSTVLYTLIRGGILGGKAHYPAVYHSEKEGDFIVENLGQLELFCTISSPGLVCIATLATYRTDILLMRSIALLVTIQALLPFSRCHKDYISFLIIPVVIMGVGIAGIFFDKEFRYILVYSYAITI